MSCCSIAVCVLLHCFFYSFCCFVLTLLSDAIHNSKTNKSTYSAQDPWSAVQYSIVQYSTLQFLLSWICYHSSSLMSPLQPPHATTPTPTCHHSNTHMPPLQPPHDTTPTPTHHHSSSPPVTTSPYISKGIPVQRTVHRLQAVQ